VKTPSGRRTLTPILLLLASSVAASAAPPVPKLMVCYIEAPVAQTAPLAQSLERHADPKIVLLREAGRPNRMALIERWTQLDAKAAAARAASLQAQIAGKIEAPLDCRMGNALTPFITASGAFHVLMHVDVVPAASAAASKLLLAQRNAVLAAGGLGFEAAVQADRPNHFAVHEIWISRAAYETYAATAAGKDFRRQLDPIKGAPFDDRFLTGMGGR
jgi:quinol monooxygenase YgiN